MQFVKFREQSFNVVQAYFIERSIELLYMGSIDSYRVKMHNPLSILIELKKCLEDFQIGKIKHFKTIKTPGDKYSLVDELIDLINSKPNFLKFKSISELYLIKLCKTLSENNFKKLIITLDILIQDNLDYIESIFNDLEIYMKKESPNFRDLDKIEQSLNYLYSSLINNGFSKNYIYRKFYAEFVSFYSVENGFDKHFELFKNAMISEERDYLIYFKINTTNKVVEALSQFANARNVKVLGKINEYKFVSDKVKNEFKKFENPGKGTVFLEIRVEAKDYLAALKISRADLAEYLDVINLGLSDEEIRVNTRALVIDLNNSHKGAFQHNRNILDGKYKVEKDHYLSFSQRLPKILKNPENETESTDKIKSAVRYLRLGNISTEIEHKFINYWIGLEYLFSNYESNSSITRLKLHFIKAHALAYVKRNLMAFYKNVHSINNHLGEELYNKIEKYSKIENLLDPTFYDELWNQRDKFPLIAFRAQKFKNMLFTNSDPNAKEYIKRHTKNLEVHLTRIYRLRNEIIHDAATNTSNEQVASHLRYYLTFMLNEVITYMSIESSQENRSIEQYFLMNEITLGNIEQKGYPLKDFLQLDISLDFLS